MKKYLLLGLLVTGISVSISAMKKESLQILNKERINQITSTPITKLTQTQTTRILTTMKKVSKILDANLTQYEQQVLLINKLHQVNPETDNKVNANLQIRNTRPIRKTRPNLQTSIDLDYTDQFITPVLNYIGQFNLTGCEELMLIHSLMSGKGAMLDLLDRYNIKCSCYGLNKLQQEWDNSKTTTANDVPRSCF